MNAAQIVLASVVSLLLVILILSLFPFYVIIDYRDGQTSAYVKWFIIRRNLFPAKKKKAEKAPQKEQKPSIAREAEKRSKDPFFDQLSSLFSGLASAGRILRLVLSQNRADIFLSVKTGGDAAEAAIACGRLSAYIHTALAALANYLEIRKKQINIYPDYNSEKTVYTLHARVFILPIRLLFNIHRLLPELLLLSDALPSKSNKKGAKKS